MEFVPTIEDDTVVYFLIQNVAPLPVILEKWEPEHSKKYFQTRKLFYPITEVTLMTSKIKQIRSNWLSIFVVNCLYFHKLSCSTGCLH